VVAIEFASRQHLKRRFPGTSAAGFSSSSIVAILLLKEGQIAIVPHGTISGCPWRMHALSLIHVVESPSAIEEKFVGCLFVGAHNNLSAKLADPFRAGTHKGQQTSSHYGMPYRVANTVMTVSTAFVPLWDCKFFSDTHRASNGGFVRNKKRASKPKITIRLRRQG
jgi:hypothetical protein